MKKKQILLILCFCFVAFIGFYFLKRNSHTQAVRIIDSTDMAAQSTSPSTNTKLSATGTSRSIASFKRPDYEFKKKSREVYLKSLKDHKKIIKPSKTRSFQTHNDKLTMVENLVALKEEEYKGSFGEKVKFLNGYIIFEPSEEYQNASQDQNSHAVVQFQSTGDIGVVTGKIALQFEKGIEAQDSVFERNNVEVLKNIPIINFYYVEPVSEDPYEVAQRLKLESGVKSVEVEVLKNPSIPD